MSESYRRLKSKRSANEVDESGFTLIELLIVIVVLGILAAIVVFALSGVTNQSAQAACQSDAKTIGVGVAALQAQNPSVGGLSSATWKSDLTSGALTGGPFLQSWPQGNSASYAVSVAPAPVVGPPPTPQTQDNNTNGLGGSPVTPQYGDVVITTPNNKTAGTPNIYDATQFPIEACVHLQPNT
jgi:prepilin-type N-terminal cleavage/methylation domain-containing protein